MNSVEASAVILAAGRGTRMGQKVPKAFIHLAGKPLITYSIEKFLSRSAVREVILVTRPDDQPRLHNDLIATLDLPNDVRLEIVDGGEERQDSSFAGVSAARSELIFVHDAARPLFPLALLDELLSTTTKHRAAIPAVPVVDSLRRIDAQGHIIEDVSREGLHIVQTPQCFYRGDLHRALTLADGQQRTFTDEAAALLEMLNIRAMAVPGSHLNLKITTAEDLALAESYLHYPELDV